MRVFRRYYYLAKPGIVYGNAYTAIAGFFIATTSSLSISTGIGMVIGICLIMASGCVINNIIDRSIDKKMQRTKKRSLVVGNISVYSALIYGTSLGLMGLLVLLLTTNLLTSFLALSGWVFYVIIYGIAKRKTVYGTLVGSISGAIPPLVGYTAVRNSIDIGSFIIFFVLVFWQLAHFYAIAIIRKKDYASAHIPVLPIVKGIATTKQHIVASIILFGISSFALFYYQFTGWIYALCMTALSIIWLTRTLRSYHIKDDTQWAKSVFRFSLTTLVVFCLIAGIDMLVFKQPQLVISLMVQYS